MIQVITNKDDKIREISNQVLFLEIKNSEEKKVYQSNELAIVAALKEMYKSVSPPMHSVLADLNFKKDQASYYNLSPFSPSEKLSSHSQID